MLRILLTVFAITLLATNLRSVENSKTAEYKSLQNAKKKFNTSIQVDSTPKTYVSNFQKFVKEADSKIDTNKKKFSELKAILNKRYPENKNCSNKITELEFNNSKLEIELDNYVLQGNGNWELFSKSLLQDLTKLDLEYKNARF